MIYLQLLLSYLKIGFFGFGGGYAMLSLIQNEIVVQRGWLTSEQLTDIIAISQVTPGPIAINSATYLGYHMAGFWGALVSTVAVVLPSFLIIFAISLVFDQFLAISYVNYAFQGIRVCVVYLILSAGLKVFRSLAQTWKNRLLCFGVFGLMTAFSLFSVNFSSIWFIVICGVLGLALFHRKGAAE